MSLPNEPTLPSEPAVPPPVMVATYALYSHAQAAVDTLSDEGFPVEHVSIVWRGLRRVEQVTGRRTVVTAAVEGALSGAWFGSLLGLLFVVFADQSTTRPAIATVGTYLAVGAVAGAGWLAAAHWMRRGTRDFSTVPQLDAEAYELWVAENLAGLAEDVLGVRTFRATDPQPEGGIIDLTSTTGPSSEPAATERAGTVSTGE
jgi:hypothetical protein